MSTTTLPVGLSFDWITCLSLFLVSCAIAAAQGYGTDFEPPLYAGTAAGTVVTGQDGWYLPPVAGSQDGNVFTYTGNALGIALNPLGGMQFEGGLGNATGPARAQRPVDFSTGGIWRAEWDCTGRWNNPTGPAVDNIGSWSMQPSTAANPPLSRYFQQLMSWGSTPTQYSGPLSPPTNQTATFQLFHIHWGIHTAAAPNTITFQVPGPEWLDLPVNNWFHISVTWDFDVAQIHRVSIRNITTNGTTTATNVTSFGWYLQGGPNSTLPLPTDVRLFAGGNGDVSAWDNLSMVRLCDCRGDMNADSMVTTLDTPGFVTAIMNEDYDICTDLNQNGADDGADIAPFVQQVLANAGAGTTCP